MTPLPVVLPATPTATEWWEGLSESARTELATLFDPQQEDCFFGVGPEGGEPPTVRGGRFIPHDDAWGLEDWGPDWFDYLMEHPEWIELMQPIQFHLGGVCMAHPLARAALATGHIPADFDCPFASSGCPMRRLVRVSGGRSLRLAGLRGTSGERRVIALPVT